jgi:hypothetical protein
LNKYKKLNEFFEKELIFSEKKREWIFNIDVYNNSHNKEEKFQKLKQRVRIKVI